MVKDSVGKGYPTIRLTYENSGAMCELDVDAVIDATGRKPNVEGMDLEKAGVHYHDVKGILVDEHLRTSNKDVFAVGDCCSSF